MFNWLTNLIKPAPERIEKKVLDQFSFLLDDYNFTYAKENLGDAIDKDGKFFCYGPLNAYQFYNENVCISILHLVQPDDYNVYITPKKSTDQVYIRNGTEIPSYLTYRLPLLASQMKESISTQKELFGQRI